MVIAGLSSIPDIGLDFDASGSDIDPSKNLYNWIACNLKLLTNDHNVNSFKTFYYKLFKNVSKIEQNIWGMAAILK